jgi:hypothetical protein
MQVVTNGVPGWIHVSGLPIQTRLFLRETIFIEKWIAEFPIILANVLLWLTT